MNSLILKRKERTVPHGISTRMVSFVVKLLMISFCVKWIDIWRKCFPTRKKRKGGCIFLWRVVDVIPWVRSHKKKTIRNIGSDTTKLCGVKRRIWRWSTQRKALANYQQFQKRFLHGDFLLKKTPSKLEKYISCERGPKMLMMWMLQVRCVWLNINFIVSNPKKILMGKKIWKTFVHGKF